jgi:23S rRNA A2030 N6-methylase RlmJ
MSKMYPECPLTIHNNCRDIDNPKLCALVRKDKKCLKEIHKNENRKKPVSA